MYPLYKDLRIRLATPKWIDRNGVPRYSDFTPKEAAEIYCNWVALLTVECQSCNKTFQCATALDWVMVYPQDNTAENTAPSMIPHLAGWGDAPWHNSEGSEDEFDSQCAGTTMSTDIVALRVWFRDRDGNGNEFEGWAEVSEPECFLPDGFMEAANP